VIHVVWEDDTPGNWEIYHKKSTNNGATWSTTKRITWTAEETRGPAIALDSNRILFVVWHDFTPGNAEIYFRRSTDEGSTWSAAYRLTWTSEYSEDPAIAIGSDNAIHVAWRDNTPGNEEIYYKKSTNLGKSWTPMKRLTWTSDWSQFANLAIDGGGAIHLAWDDPTSGNAEIYHKKSTDGGETWSPMKRLTWTPGGSFELDMAINSASHIHVVWEDFTPGLPEIYHKSSPDGGTTWNAVRRITWTSGQSLSPAIAGDSSGTVHVFWHDNTPGNNEIYYKNGN
jgi:BNR repeat-like domain